MDYSVEEFDKAKTQVLKYILYQKRCEQEIRKKFITKINENMLEDIIEYLTEAGYINDKDYIESKIENFKLLKNLSIKEISYKLLAKGVNKKQLEEYINLNIEELNNYEEKSAYKIIQKKLNMQEEQEIKNYLYKKGYKSENINNAFESVKKN